MSDVQIAIAGNPNCGKTTLFNALTGSRQLVGNWPGVTVEKKVGHFTHAGAAIELVDLPGVYSLSVAGGATSLDERLARDFILSNKPDLIVDIIDASNIERNLYLTVQLLEMGVPMLVALNMMDVARAHGVTVDAAALSARLGCPVVPLVAAEGQGLDLLKDEMLRAARARHVPTAKLQFDAAVESVIASLEPFVVASIEHADPRWLAIKHLEGDELCPVMTDPAVIVEADRLRDALEQATDMEADTAIACGRYDFVTEIAGEAVRRNAELSRTLSDRLDKVVLSRIFGIPIFLAVMYGLFTVTISLGGAFIDFFDILAGAIFVDWPAAALQAVSAPAWATTLIADGVGGGIQTVATFVPIVGLLFLFLSALEDSGYMARAAFVMDRFMRMVGLPGKAFVPLIVGFGCNVPAIMAARTLDNPRDRTLTVMMAPFMSCGARLAVFALFAAAFFPTGGQNLVFALYILGILAAVGTGLLLKSTLLRGESSPFVMELPAYHLPRLRAVGMRAWDRLRAFILGAGKIIVVMVVALSFLNSWGTDGSFGNEDTDASVLSEIGRTMMPAFAPMGLQEDNWPAAVGLFTGILAKEAVVGTLNTLYSGMGDTAAEEGPSFAPFAAIGEALASVRDNLAALASGGATATAEMPGSYGTMAALFDGQAGAFAYLLMILLYTPCVAALGAMARESGWQWAAFAASWTMLLGYGSAVIFYQAATVTRHPLGSLEWIVAVLLVFCAVFAALRLRGPRFATGRQHRPVVAE
ncbi:Fe(2+) transporter permease subunit FeoB [Tropicimonas sp. IMCC34043]|uniref:Fe(2+) transporter permease subunit FeoB n=1 Tax=Tropicimonas sp. IMCC34043 TaxID=2248760 RepID=UPI000E25EE12|nr:Fe(2+) transporter permease subunit FeoB [Tropicimonas sp. IMCC34043]